MRFIILCTCPGTLHKKEHDLHRVPRSIIPKALSLAAQSLRGNPKLYQLPQSVSDHCASRALGPLHICGSPYVHFSSAQPFCWPGKSCIFVPMYFSLLGSTLIQITEQDPQSISFPVYHTKRMWYTSPLRWKQVCYYFSQELGYTQQAHKNKLLRQTPTCQLHWLNILSCYSKV